MSSAIGLARSFGRRSQRVGVGEMTNAPDQASCEAEGGTWDVPFPPPTGDGRHVCVHNECLPWQTWSDTSKRCEVDAASGGDVAAVLIFAGIPLLVVGAGIWGVVHLAKRALGH